MSLYGVGPDRTAKGLQSSDADLDRKFWVAIALFGFLAVLVWFSVGEGNVLVLGRPVEIRLVPMVVIGALALRTVLARHAEKIRRGAIDGAGDKGGNTAPRS
jgi:hypothetical protein